MAQREYFQLNFAIPANLKDGKTLLTGIRLKNKKHNSKNKSVYITGFYNSPLDGPVLTFVLDTTLEGVEGGLCSRHNTWNLLSYPSSSGKTTAVTNLYGPNNGPVPNSIQVVGNYTTFEDGIRAFGCLYQGPLRPSTENPGQWKTLTPSESALNTIAHSTHGNLVVGAYDIETPKNWRAFLYDIQKDLYYDIVQEGAVRMTAYGIWQNKENHYTICGGYTELDLPNFEKGYLLDWNNQTQTFSNFRSYVYRNSPQSKITHFNGISGFSNPSNSSSKSSGSEKSEKSERPIRTGYTLTGDTDDGAFFARIYIKDGQEKIKWSSVKVPQSEITSGNSVLDDVVIGVYVTPTGQVNGYFSSLE